MAASVNCEIVSASESIFQGAVKMLVITGSAGEMGIMPGHAALLSDLKPGPVRIIKADDTEEVYFLSGGYVEVQPSGIAVLADTAIRADNIDEAAAAQAVKDAENDVGNNGGDIEYSKAASMLAEATAQLRTVRALKKKLGK
tara:strand:+ start:365 stop:790 length:426 start_codon:yes stop_codon:yes gene_type:complete